VSPKEARQADMKKYTTPKEETKIWGVTGE